MPDDFQVDPEQMRRFRAFLEYERGGRDSIHAPGGSTIVAPMICLPGNQGWGGPDRPPWDRPRDEIIQPAPPLTGNENFILQIASTFFPGFVKGTVTILDLIRQFWPASYSWKALNGKVDVPLTPLFTVPSVDMLYLMAITACTKTTDAGANSSCTYSMTFSSADGKASPVTGTYNLTALASAQTQNFPVVLKAGTGVTFQSGAGGTYGNASYDFIISAIPLSSDQMNNNAQNLLL